MSSKQSIARVIAFYLPQFHPIPENDEWWGKGFTEWTNTAKAKPLFRGHYQPHIPADLGFYDLRVPETRIAQAEMAREHGIEAFCYYHYWFAGKRLLERPFNEVLETGQPDFPFCLCWANQTWSGIWHGVPERILIEQTYPGYDDHRKHFDLLFPAFIDRRYVTVDGKPLFMIFRPYEIPDIQKVTDFWRELAAKSGLKGLYLVGYTSESHWIPQEHGFDSSITDPFSFPNPGVSRRKPLKWLRQQYQKKTGKPEVFFSKDMLLKLQRDGVPRNGDHPCVVPNWDNTPRSGKNGFVFHESSPGIFKIYLQKALNIVQQLPPERRLIFVKSWNEWAEGNHLEPDLRFGRAYLEVVKDLILKSKL